jgi:MFS family permease
MTAREPVPQRLALAMLVIAYTLNFVDRQVIGILAGPIKAELLLSDTQLGLMGGVAFALFYSVLGIPLGRLADRTSRSGVITGALAVWSAFTALCALAPGFWSLFLCRVGVGVGEAGGVAPAYALVADSVPRPQRARALAIFAFGSPLGSAIGIFLGGWLATEVDWRMAFVVLGLAGVAFVPVFRFVVREPVRPVLPVVEIRTVWRELAVNRTFWLLSLAAANTSVVGYGLLFWLPSFFTRSFGLDLLTASRVFGAIVLAGGVTGLWGGGSLAAPLYALGLLSHSLPLTIALFLLPHALGLMWLGPVTAAIQQLVAPESRATASAVFLFVLNLLGIGGGAVFFGVVSDALGAQYGAESLRFAILAGLGFYLLAAALFVAASRRIEEDWRD